MPTPKRTKGPAAGRRGTPAKYRVRVRMYRQGLGDCFLLTFPRKDRPAFQLLIDCGALNRDKKFMTRIVEHIEQSVKPADAGKARLDLVVATHEHKDHLSGFNQAREVFNRMEIGGVWLGWTENLTSDEAKALKKAKKVAMAKLQAALASPFAATATIQGVRSLLNFSEEDDTTGSGLIAEALEYLKMRGKDANHLQFLEPGQGPLKLEGVEDWRVYALGPPRDPTLLKTSSVTEKMKGESIIYHLGLLGEEQLNALDSALVSGDSRSAAAAEDRCHPFAAVHRIPRQNNSFPAIARFVKSTYDNPDYSWRKIDEDWLDAFGQLALALDNDTNNTSLVLAFEHVSTGEVLLFVGDAQVGNWLSWKDVRFKVAGAAEGMPAHDLLKRTVFYKVGHHCSHNATIKTGGLELMEKENLVAFIPLDIATAKMQGRKDARGKPKGWDMPAAPLYQRLLKKAAKRVVISDVKQAIPQAAANAGITTDAGLTYIDYTLT